MTTPYSKITVTELCRKAHLSRKTFYSTFQDKEAVLESIFVEDVVVPIREMNRLLSIEQRRQLTNVLLENIYARIWDDKEFYQALVRPMKGVDDTFIRVVTHSLETLNNEIIAELSSTEGYEAEYASYFFAASQAMLVQKLDLRRVSHRAQRARRALQEDAERVLAQSVLRTGDIPPTLYTVQTHSRGIGPGGVIACPTRELAPDRPLGTFEP